MAKKQTANGGRSTSAKRQSSSSRRSKPAAKAAPSKTTGKRASKGKATPKKKTTRRPTIAKKRNERWEKLLAQARTVLATATDQEFWRQQRAKLPPWIDELGAILLVVIGAVLLTALVNNTTEATVSVTLAKIQRQLFGAGAYLVSTGILATGVILLLPKFGRTVAIDSLRIAGLEVGFGAIQAILHLIEFDPEGRALAREGKGGGYLGWALSEIPLSLGFSYSLSILAYGLILSLALIFITGLRVRHVVVGLGWLSTRIQDLITRLDAWNFERKNAQTLRMAQFEPQTPSAPRLSQARAIGGQLRRIARLPGRRKAVAPDADQVNEKTAESPSANAAAEAAGHTTSTNSGANSDNSHKLSARQRAEIAQQVREQMGAENGRSIVSPGEPGERSSVVPRELLPDAPPIPASTLSRIQELTTGPIEREFTVDDFNETRKVGKRDGELPPLQLLSDVELNKPTQEEINTNARIIRNTLLDFDVEVEVVDVRVGPTVTQYLVTPYTESVTEEGERVLNRVRVSQIANLNGDLALALSAKRLRIQAPVPGTSYVGIEVPNREPSTVALRPVLESETFYKKRQRPLALPLGRDVSGDSFVADLQTMPHLLIAGTTGSGKSIMLAAMTTAFVMNNSPQDVQLVLLDPKMVELSRFNGLPHLLGPVETELDRIIEVLRWATREMDRRYKLLEKEAARNIEAYNAGLGRRRQDEKLPYIVIIIDEIGDLMMQRPDETERALTRLAQMARAVGMHLMVATQRPSVDVITGLIKANFPARASFAVASSTDSRVILDANGAEALMGRGDMLFLASDASGPQRIQGCYISDEEVEAVVSHWAEWQAEAGEATGSGSRAIGPWERGLTRRELLSETDPMLEDAIELVIQEGEASASLIQRRLSLGYPRAARIMDMLHELGIIGASKAGGRTREVLVKPGADPFKRIVDERMNDKS